MLQEKGTVCASTNLLCLYARPQVHRRRDSPESEYIQTNADGQRRRHHQRGLARTASVSMLYIRFNGSDECIRGVTEQCF